MWQAVEVEEDAPPVGAALGCDPRGDDGGLGRHKVARRVRWRDDNPARIGEPSGVRHRCGESGPSTSYSFEGRAASRYGSPFFSPAAASGPGRAHLPVMLAVAAAGQAPPVPSNQR